MVGYVYIIQSLKNGRYYIGSSEDPKRRLNEFHNIGKVKSTKFLIPWKIVFSQKCFDMSEARKIEFKLKSYKSRIILDKIIDEGGCSIISSG